MTDLALQLLWVAAHHGLRRHGAANTMSVADRCECWRAVHQITSALGNPPAPRGPR